MLLQEIRDGKLAHSMHGKGLRYTLEFIGKVFLEWVGFNGLHIFARLGQSRVSGKSPMEPTECPGG